MDRKEKAHTIMLETAVFLLSEVMRKVLVDLKNSRDELEDELGSSPKLAQIEEVIMEAEAALELAEQVGL